MKLKALLEKIKYECLQGDVEAEITNLTHDSRKVQEGSVFACIVGAVVDGHNFIKDVIALGAKALIVEREVEAPESVTVIKVEDTRYALAYLSAAYFGYPAKQMKMIGITGTKGKTSTSYMIQDMLKAAGYKVGALGTIEAVIGDEKIPMSNTTPDSFTLHSYFKRMLDEGCDAVVMEVSSQGLKYHRTAGIEFDYGLFTNLSPDHIGPNEHDSFEDYMQSKAMLFKQSKVGIANIDDEHFAEITKDATCPIETFGLHENADLRASGIELVREKDYLGIDFQLSGLEDYEVQEGVPGKFSVYNALGAICVARHFGIGEEIVNKVLREFKVKGRIQIVPTGSDYTLIIDYAHNAVSLESILKTLREYHPARLISMFGCGGNRSKLRRYEMGEVSGKFADFTIITSDNPRFEEPQDIIDDIIIGMKKTDGEYKEIIDRKEAISYCINNAKRGDIVLLAGKGHEDYQEIRGIKYHMLDEEIAKNVLSGVKY